MRPGAGSSEGSCNGSRRLYADRELIFLQLSMQTDLWTADLPVVKLPNTSIAVGSGGCKSAWTLARQVLCQCREMTHCRECHTSTRLS